MSQHSELLGDQVLGPEAQARFLPTRFSVEGQAIDARGMKAHHVACPKCHLVVSRALLETEPLFMSIIGVPASGKSYFLTAMTWELRRVLPAEFGVSFSDVDTTTNRSLNEYEETLFLHGDPDELVAIRKTELQGELYDQVKLGQHILSLPRPFLFTLRPTGRHPLVSHAEEQNRVICLYDNAGEHFQPGMDTAASPVTQHLAQSRVLMFLYDPTQDPRFREKCQALSTDPQLHGKSRSQRQETILTEAGLRIRSHAGLTAQQKHDRPLLVIVPKSDIWAPLVDVDITTPPLVHKGDGIPARVDLLRIEKVSHRVRAMLVQHAPEFVAAAEDLCKYVTYIPVSALGHAPESDEKTGLLGIRPRDIKPRWASVPILYAFAKWTTGLIAGDTVVAQKAVRQP